MATKNALENMHSSTIAIYVCTGFKFISSEFYWHFRAYFLGEYNGRVSLFASVAYECKARKNYF